MNRRFLALLSLLSLSCACAPADEGLHAPSQADAGSDRQTDGGDADRSADGAADAPDRDSDLVRDASPDPLVADTGDADTGDFATDAVADVADVPDDADADAADVAGDVVSTDADVAELGPNVVVTAQGPVGGTADGAVRRFLGVPYAAPPVGDLRWRAPRPPAAREEVFAADAFGPACPQGDGSWVVEQGLDRSEDCLTLNLWAPVDPPQPAPVMVWLHGGGFFLGSGAEPQFDGTALAQDGAVVVTLNYRLGALGFLAHGALRDDDSNVGNYGLLDTIAALAWVRENAAAFGGDPARVTIFGESAGGILVCALLTSPLARDLFHAAIMQSGFCTVEAATLDMGTDLQPSAFQTGAAFSRAAGCQGPDTATCLRGLSLDQVLTTVERMGDAAAGLGLVVDDHALEETPWAAMQRGAGAPVQFIAGTVADEGTVFLAQTDIPDDDAYRRFLDDTFTDVVTPFILVLYPARDFETPWHAAAAVFGDALFTCPTREAMRAHVRAGNPGWLYYFGHVTDEGRRRGLGAYHASEVPFVFGTQPANPVSDEISSTARQLWTSFAATGRPTAIPWPPYTTLLDPVLELDADPEILEQWRDDRCRFWAGGD